MIDACHMSPDGPDRARRWAPAAEPERLCYLGKIKLTSAAGKPMGSQVIMLEKILDRDKLAIVEHGRVIFTGGKVEESTMRMARADNTLTLTDDAKALEGTGKLFGPIQIEDENFM